MAETLAVSKVTLEGAQKIIAAVLKEAEARKKQISVAVADPGGHLVAFARTDKASLTTLTVAMNKSRCTAYMAFPTGKLSKEGNERSDFHALAITLAAGPENMVNMQGGVPIIIKGECVGGVAVSGAGHSDGDIAWVGALSLEGAEVRKPKGQEPKE
jgi:glc operon protein GlcG